MPLPSRDDISISGAQLARFPVNEEEPVSLKTIFGPSARVPLVIDMLLFITHMSFGALSKEAKIALARGSAAAKTAMCSGEGGILEESRRSSYRYIYEYVPNEYSLSEENLKLCDAVEIKIGQAVKPGIGISLPRHATRISSTGKALRSKWITIDGKGGATGSVQKLIKDSASVPTMYALVRARGYLEREGITNISLIITGGLRVSSDVAKALALGCRQYRMCHTGRCPTGITSQDPLLRARIDIDAAAQLLASFLAVTKRELEIFTRMTGNKSTSGLSPEILSTQDQTIARLTVISLGGQKYKEQQT
jgi:glutamate synthase domain-containing protein 2